MQEILLGVPVPCRCGAHPARETPHGYTHAHAERCPRVTEDYQCEVARGTCCQFDLLEVRRILVELDEPHFAERVGREMSAEAAIAFGERIAALAAKLTNHVDDDAAELERLDTVAAAGAWYAALGRSGFGVTLLEVTRLS